MMESILGIDIAKDTFEVEWRQAGRHGAAGFPNTPAGFQQLSRWLTKRKVKQVHACLEATGRYGDALAQYLQDQAHLVSVVNPARVKAYGESQLQRNKTDRVDAALITDFCQTQHPEVWTPPSRELRELQEFLHQYDALQGALQQAKNRLTAGFQSETVLAQLRAQRTFLENQIKELTQSLTDHLQRYPELRAQHALLDSIPGVAFLTAARLLALNLPRFATARAAAAFAGLTPMVHQSGSSVHRKSHVSKMGSAQLRGGLYMPILSAQRFNPVIKAFCARLTARHKPPMAIIVAAMHKLIVLAYGVLKSGQPFDPKYAAKATA
jgi:transposase